MYLYVRITYITFVACTFASASLFRRELPGTYLYTRRCRCRRCCCCRPRGRRHRSAAPLSFVPLLSFSFLSFSTLGCFTIARTGAGALLLRPNSCAYIYIYICMYVRIYVYIHMCIRVDKASYVQYICSYIYIYIYAPCTVGVLSFHFDCCDCRD